MVAAEEEGLPMPESSVVDTVSIELSVPGNDLDDDRTPLNRVDIGSSMRMRVAVVPGLVVIPPVYRFCVDRTWILLDALMFESRFGFLLHLMAVVSER